MEWIRQNPEKLPVLAWRRLWEHMRPRSLYETFLLVLAVGGFALARRHVLVRLLSSFIAINALVVMATLSAGGRYLFPVKASLYVLGAVGLVALAGWLAVQIARRRAGA